MHISTPGILIESTLLAQKELSISIERKQAIEMGFVCVILVHFVLCTAYI